MTGEFENSIQELLGLKPLHLFCLGQFQALPMLRFPSEGYYTIVLM